MKDKYRVIVRLKSGQKQVFDVTDVSDFEMARQGVISQVQNVVSALTLVPKHMPTIVKEAA